MAAFNAVKIMFIFYCWSSLVVIGISNNSESTYGVNGDMKVSFLCIGAQKGGTTWLNEQLLHHKRVYLPPVKEVHYFNYLHSPSDSEWIPDHYRRPARIRILSFLENNNTDWESISYYARLMALIESNKVDENWYSEVYSLCKDSDLLKGDITPAYLAMPMSGIQAVHDYNPDMRLIVMLREPVSRAISAARMMLKRKNIDQASDDMWRTVIRGNGVVEKSCYARQLERWLKVFPKEQLLVIPYERIAVEPKDVMNEVCDFLGVEQLRDEELLTERVHVGKGYTIPKWLTEKLHEKLAEERKEVEKMFPSLSKWWE